MVSLLKFLLTQIKPTKQAHKIGGFTLLELLVAMILAALVIVPLLGFMVDILTSDRQEQAKSSTEQDIKTALEYIDRDLQQAVYIYDGTGLKQIQSQIPPDSGQAGGCDPSYCIPVLVFWKREPSPNTVNPSGRTSCPSSPPTFPNPPVCNDAYVYALVGYYLIQDNQNNDPNNYWSKTARIARFEIKDQVPDTTPNAPPNAPPIIAPDPGFNPFNIQGLGSLSQKMNQWQKAQPNSPFPYNKQVNYTIDFNTQVLVDYIDNTPTSILPQTNIPAAITCIPGSPQGSLQVVPGEQQVPPPGPPNLTSFYACVNYTNTTARVYIRGNAKARLYPNQTPAPTYTASDSTYFPSATLQVKGNGYLYNQQ